jgi:adenine-specific DNA-methyltransferase
MTIAPQLSPILEADRLGRRALIDVERAKRSEFGQFFTPPFVASFMASLFSNLDNHVRLLDAGAGVGTLTAAVLERCFLKKPKSVTATMYELDMSLETSLQQSMAILKASARASNTVFQTNIQIADFLLAGVDAFSGLFGSKQDLFTHAILNPPYAKIARDTTLRQHLEFAGIDATNLYTAFLDVAIELLEDEGELVAITPRSFFNGAYFTPFRKRFLERMQLRHIQIIDSRSGVFGDVLQETVIFHAVKTKAIRQFVAISNVFDLEEAPMEHSVLYSQVVRPDDAESFICVASNSIYTNQTAMIEALPHTLSSLNFNISTGRVVDFRAREALRHMPEVGDHALIYPTHLQQGTIVYPLESAKANAMLPTNSVRSLLVPEGFYVLVKRFSTKEETRRVVAALFEPEKARFGAVGFENHLNYIHQNGAGLTRETALGLVVYLNSTAFDTAFRTFSGHTQVNATDIRNMTFPSLEVLSRLATRVSLPLPAQEVIDDIVNQEVFAMVDKNLDEAVKRKIEQAILVLKSVPSLPAESVNERSALILLALLDLIPQVPWSDASRPLRGVTPIMEFIARHYNKTYAPNSRETFRKATLHHFLRETLAVLNPDDPARSTNSPNNVYQINAEFAEVLRNLENENWQNQLQLFMANIPQRQQQDQIERYAQRIPVIFGGEKILLSAGGQNPLIQKIIEEFCERFALGSQAVYIGDTSSKTQVFYNRDLLESLGVVLDDHGKMPDVIVYQPERNWLFLIEAVTSHGAITTTRLRQLEILFQHCKAGIVFVTAFETRATMRRYLADIAWETEVWVAETPEHLIHFNGDKFFGPRK